MALKIKTITIRTINNEDFKQQILHLGKSQRQISNEFVEEPPIGIQLETFQKFAKFTALL